jgi:hypothetical protein
MYMGLTEPELQVVKFEQQRLLAECERQRLIASLLPASSGSHLVSTAIRQQLGTLLVRTGQRILGVHALTRESLSSSALNERGAAA